MYGSSAEDLFIKSDRTTKKAVLPTERQTLLSCIIYNLYETFYIVVTYALAYFRTDTDTDLECTSIGIISVN